MRVMEVILHNLSKMRNDGDARCRVRVSNFHSSCLNRSNNGSSVLILLKPA